jgi:hypothetical protein
LKKFQEFGRSADGEEAGRLLHFVAKHLKGLEGAIRTLEPDRRRGLDETRRKEFARYPEDEYSSAASDYHEADSRSSRGAFREMSARAR